MATDEDPRRRNVGFRLAPKGIAWLDMLRDENRTTRTEVVKAVMYVARKHETEVRDYLRGRL